LTDKANDKLESPQGNYNKSKSDGQVRIRVAPRPDELLDATCKRSIVQIIRIKTKKSERIWSREEVGRSVRKNRAKKEKKLAKVD